MSKGAAARRFVFNPKWFGIIIGIFIFAALWGVRYGTDIFERIEIRLLDAHFNLKTLRTRSTIQEGVTLEERNPRISPDILLVGIDPPTLEAYGRWPFPRYRHADLLNSFSRIQSQGDREASVFLDFFFNNEAGRPFDDVMLLEAMQENGQVFLETILSLESPSPDYVEEAYARQRVMIDRFGEFTNIGGTVDQVVEYYGVDPPMIPFGKATAGFGHANFFQDPDKKYRRLQLVVRYGELLEEIRFEELIPAFVLDEPDRERLAYRDKEGRYHTIEYPLTEEILTDLAGVLDAKSAPRADDTDNDGTPDDYYFVIRKYRDHFIPAITLALALDYFGKTPADVEVVFGSHILIDAPQRWDPDSGAWMPYEIVSRYPEIDLEGNLVREGETRLVDEIRIPVDERGQMLINYMGIRSNPARGGIQTYPVRSFAGYADRAPPADPEQWPRTKAVGGKILMAGAFSLGMAEDEKPTPYGLMYGVEIHANALNTIIMDNFLIGLPVWADIVIMAVLTLGVALMGSRLNTGWAFGMVLILLLGSFLAVTILFESQNLLIDWAAPALGMIFAFVGTVVYRVLYGEKEKKRITNNFGKFLSPAVVSQMIESGQDPETGGEDVDCTIFFSDIRSFSKISEQMEPHDLTEYLNDYLEYMTRIVIDWKGTLDKYIGDAVMAIWGAPIKQENDAVFACKSALQQIAVLDEFNEKWMEKKRYRPIRIGIGINSGTSTVGNMGSDLRMDYSVIGDNVNLASRLEGANKQYDPKKNHSGILISETTKKKIDHEPFVLRELDDIRVMGRFEPVTIYELLDFDGDMTPPETVGGESKAG